MKAIIYAGIGLLSVATVYGTVDYYSSQKKGILNNLYKEEEPSKETESIAGNTSVIPIKIIETNLNSEKNLVVNTVAKTIKKIRLPKRTIRLEEFSRGRIVEPMPQIIRNIEEKKSEPAKVEDIKVKEEASKPSVKRADIIKPDRRISLDMFSRAPLRRRVKADTAIKILKPDQ